MAANNKTFILGFGTQKAGTTWLHKYLDSHECSNFGVAKEYHIWDAKFLEEAHPRRLRLADVFRKRSDAIWSRYPSRELAIRHIMQSYDGFYEAYFSRLASGQKWLTGDITPGYAGLLPDHIRHVKSRLERKGFQVKAIFLMRDPVERCWSAIRHHYRVSGVSHIGQDTHDQQLKHLSETLRSPSYVSRTQYDRTIANIEECFEPSDVYFGLYETMFEASELDRLSNFVGLPAAGDLISERVNVSPKKGEMTLEMAAEIIEA